MAEKVRSNPSRVPGARSETLRTPQNVFARLGPPPVGPSLKKNNSVRKNIRSVVLLALLKIIFRDN